VSDPEFRAAMDRVRTPIAYQDADEFRAFDKGAPDPVASVGEAGRDEPTRRAIEGDTATRFLRR
jgi:hypothetical protein